MEKDRILQVKPRGRHWWVGSVERFASPLEAIAKAIRIAQGTRRGRYQAVAIVSHAGTRHVMWQEKMHDA